MKILSNSEYNQTIECMNNANRALKELKLENDKLKLELELVKNNLVKANVSGSAFFPTTDTTTRKEGYYTDNFNTYYIDSEGKKHLR